MQVNKHPLYHRWQEMKRRCTDKSRKDYHHYGGRGINFDPRWKFFKNFLLDMGEPKSLKLKLDRIDNNKGYSKENCRWVTDKIQAINKRDYGKCKNGHLYSDVGFVKTHNGRFSTRRCKLCLELKKKTPQPTRRSE